MGANVSKTVTIATQESLFPFASAAVKVTVLAPTSAHVNAVVDAANETVVQLSDDPLSISAATIEAVPAPSKNTVMSWQDAVGDVVSATVTVEVHIDVFPDPSVTVKVTVFGPTFAHVNAVVDAANETVVQLSDDPLSISAATIEAVPAPSKNTVMS